MRTEEIRSADNLRSIIRRRYGLPYGVLLLPSTPMCPETHLPQYRTVIIGLLLLDLQVLGLFHGLGWRMCVPDRECYLHATLQVLHHCAPFFAFYFLLERRSSAASSNRFPGHYC